MKSWARIAFVIVALAPLVLLQGMPSVAPAWFHDRLAGVPVVAWLAIAWFALMVVASWLPQNGGEPR